MFRTLSDDWFLREPAFFALYCQQQLEENARMDCALRCGQGKIEYNPLILKHKNYAEFEQLMRIEMIRLYLKHPYEREPEGCSREAMAIGSNITIADGYCMLKKEKLPLHDPAYYHLPLGMYYEWYAKEISKQEEVGDSPKQKQENQQNINNQQRQNNSKKNDNNNNQYLEGTSDLSELWREDSLQRQKINDLIERTTDWGTIPSDVIERIKASTHARINNHLIWQGFRSAILKSQRQLSRMRPNRRTGFLQMGNTRQFSTRLLVAVDVSGSISTETLEDFYSSINRLFRYGSVDIDICQFDAVIGSVHTMQQAKTEIEVQGRGGTSFQPVIDYIANHPEYDGLLILTDGQAPAPVIPPHFHSHVLWVCQDKAAYNACHEWMEKSGRCCIIR